MKRDDAKQLTDDALDQLAEQLQQGHSEQLTKYLDTMARCHNCSFGNIILIAVPPPKRPTFPDSTHSENSADS